MFRARDPDSKNEQKVDKWNNMIWVERNSRQISQPLSNNLFSFNYLPYPKDSKLEVSLEPTTIRYNLSDCKCHYTLQYHSQMNTLVFSESYRGTSEAPAFRVIQVMINKFSELTGKEVKIAHIVREKITNEETKQALKKDFPEGSGSYNQNFLAMSFFLTNNGFSTLDLIKSLAPNDDPFDHIKMVVAVQKVKEFESNSFDLISEPNPSVHIFLKKALSYSNVKQSNAAISSSLSSSLVKTPQALFSASATDISQPLLASVASSEQKDKQRDKRCCCVIL